jgi:hypothetical protein
MKVIKNLICVVLIAQSLTVSVCFSEEKLKSELNLQDIALPSEVKDLGKQSGAIYYNTSIKNKALVPAHFWGEITKSGLHFIPTDTTLIKGLSMAGGPTSVAELEEIKLSRIDGNGKLSEYAFNLSNGGDQESFNFKIESGDTIFIPKSTYYENRAYYTGLISIFISIVSTFFIVSKID